MNFLIERANFEEVDIINFLRESEFEYVQMENEFRTSNWRKLIDFIINFSGCYMSYNGQPLLRELLNHKKQFLLGVLIQNLQYIVSMITDSSINK